MSTDRYIEQLEDSELPRDTVEAAADALGFVDSFHSVLADWGLVNSNEIDVVELEKAFNGFIAEISAAGIFLASFKEAAVKLNQAAAKSEENGAPELIVHGYRKLSERVLKTQNKLLGLTEV
jgi:hypothetical protein